METGARLDLQAASDALAAQDADRYGVDHPGLCPVEVRDFHPSASADVRELRFARRLVLRPRDAPLTAHPALALLPELRLPVVALRELPRDAWLALQGESESVYSQWLAPRAQVSLRTRVSLPVRLASLRAQRWQALARQPELRALEQHQQREMLQAWLREPAPLQSVLPEREPQAWAAARQRAQPLAAFWPLSLPRLWRLYPLWPWLRLALRRPPHPAGACELSPRHLREWSWSASSFR
jgi:hypothetical protein